MAPPLPSSSVWGTGSDGAAIGEAWRSACSTSGRDNSAGRRSAASGISDSNSSSSTSSCSAGGGSFEAASLVRGCQQRRLRPWHAPTQLSALQAAGARAASSLSNVIAAEQGKTRLQGCVSHSPNEASHQDGRFSTRLAAHHRRGPHSLRPPRALPLNAPLPSNARLGRYLPAGFILNNTQVEGPVLCLPELWLMWDVGGLGDVTLESLAILDLMAPPPEVLVVGCGARVRRLPDELLTQLAERGVAVEALDTVRRRPAMGAGGAGRGHCRPLSRAASCKAH